MSVTDWEKACFDTPKIPMFYEHFQEGHENTVFVLPSTNIKLNVHCAREFFLNVRGIEATMERPHDMVGSCLMLFTHGIQSQLFWGAVLKNYYQFYLQTLSLIHI